MKKITEITRGLLMKFLNKNVMNGKLNILIDTKEIIFKNILLIWNNRLILSECQIYDVNVFFGSIGGSE